MASLGTGTPGRDQQPWQGPPRSARPWVAESRLRSRGLGEAGASRRTRQHPFWSPRPVPHPSQGTLYTHCGSSSPPPRAARGLGTALLRVPLSLSPSPAPACALSGCPPRDGCDLTCALARPARPAHGRPAHVSAQRGSRKGTRGRALLSRLPSGPSMLSTSVYTHSLSSNA